MNLATDSIKIFALFGWLRISNIRHYSVGYEYSHYSVGFEFRIFATILSEANIRLCNYYSKTESRNRISYIRNSVELKYMENFFFVLIL